MNCIFSEVSKKFLAILSWLRPKKKVVKASLTLTESKRLRLNNFLEERFNWTQMPY
jgi:hypothetical protein